MVVAIESGSGLGFGLGLELELELELVYGTRRPIGHTWEGCMHNWRMLVYLELELG